MASQRFADYAATTDYLFALKSAGMKFGIDRMTGLSEALGHPERQYPVVHVAGTNGKGSVAAMVETILRTGGLRTGLYTSPHLVKLGERVQVNRQILTEAEIIAYVNELDPVAQRLGAAGPDDFPSFFEFMTGMAFLQFARQQVDVGVIEVGMGGRLDATNVVQPEVTAITSIGLDHVAELGDNVTKIAKEKAGIIKEGRPLVLGRVPAEAEQAIRDLARLRHAPVHSVREIFGENLADYPPTNLAGDYQRWNAATAVLIARLLRGRFPQLDDDVINRGLRSVNWPGRWQRTTLGGRTLILDSSHNPEGAQVLENNLHHLVTETGRKPVIVVGVLGEFRARALLDVICRYAREVHLVLPQQSRSCSFEQLEGLVAPEARGLFHRATLAELFPDARTCTVGAPEDIVVVTGSIYLLGELFCRLQPQRGAGEGALQDF
ncbi:MAG: folylpolyglutamate synthase/dihydrofolate synthase family protein [Candidatus Didemnitutus sp.]|nr:folylpolyglutamate synthase/dihydrofolate synthase family protein [Candidatus Didemnitutus sp.]